MAELGAMANLGLGLPVYPPIAGPPEPATLARMCDGIVAAGLDGAMLAGLEGISPEQRETIRTHLSRPLL